MATRTITGTLIDPTGDPWTSETLKFELLTTFATQSDSVVLQREETATTDASGEFSITLQVPENDAWAYRCTLPDGNVFEFNLESGDATTLHDIMADANLSATVSASALSEALADYYPQSEFSSAPGVSEKPLKTASNGGITLFGPLVVLDTSLGSLLYVSGDTVTVGGALSVSGGVVTMSDLPTSDPGIPGRLWSDGGPIMVSAG